MSSLEERIAAITDVIAYESILGTGATMDQIMERLDRCDTDVHRLCGIVRNWDAFWFIEGLPEPENAYRLISGLRDRDVFRGMGMELDSFRIVVENGGLCVLGMWQPLNGKKYVRSKLFITLDTINLTVFMQNPTTGQTDYFQGS